MYLPEKSIKLLEFDKIRQMLCDCARTEGSRAAALALMPESDLVRVLNMQRRTTDAKRIGEKYCDKPEYHYILAMYILWVLVQRDEKLRRFLLDTCIDYPVYTGKDDFSQFYTLLSNGMWGAFFDQKQIPEISYASVYGYIMSCMRMMCEHPERYSPMEMFEHIVRSSITIWGFHQEKMDEIWTNVKHGISLIPEEGIRLRFD